MDRFSWALELWVEGGIKRGTRKQSQDHWQLIGYYGKFSDLVIYLVDQQIQVPEGTLENQIPALIAEIKRVEKSILRQLEQNDQTPAGALSPAD